MDVTAWLRELGLHQYEQAFRANAIDADVLPTLSGEDLKDIGVSAVGDRRRLLNAIAALRDAAPAGKAELPVAGPARPADAERRQLTVLFCDLVGSTELTARLDPEDARAVIRVYQDSCADVIGRWQGHIAKYLGDGVLAYFGWPRAQEDAAERAGRAGLELVAAVAGLEAGGAPLAARVGIASGLAVVGDLVGEGAAREEAVVGETPNLAARLQGLAEPGTVVIAPATRRLLGGLIALDDLGEHRLKGFAEPVRAWRAAGEGGARSRFEALREGSLTPLVGREPELAILREALTQGGAGTGRMVAAAGDPGVGKSRLFHSFLAAEARGWRVLRCGCRSYHAGTPWQPVVELVKAAFGIENRDDQGRAAARVRDGLSAFAAPPPSAPLLALLDLPPDDPEWQKLNPPQRRHRILDAVLGLIELESRRAPLVLVVEDLHWADGETVALLEGLIERLPALRLLLLVNSRPEFEHAWGARAWCCQLRIEPLAGTSAEHLLSALLGADPGLLDLKRHLLERTQGNPLFLEEAVRDLAEAGALAGEPGDYRPTGEAQAVRLPDTVQGILAARIDRLPPAARQLLQRAAVIGQEVPLAVLERLADGPAAQVRQHLGELQAAGMLDQSSPAADPTYTFKHALTHEVAYGSLLRETRRSLHRRVGEAMEAVYPDRLIELAEALTEHFERGEVWAKAARYGLDAGEKAKSRYAYPVGMQFATRARDAAARDAGLTQEWIWANVLLGDLASLVGDLDLANASYDQALTRSADPAEQRWIRNKRHELRYATRDGAQIAYYVHGSGDETILFVSPTGYGLVTWQPIVERLCQEFRLITVDMRGTGRSSPLVRPYTDHDSARDLAAVVHQAGCGPAVGVAVSAAPYAMVRAAVNDPNLFNKLVIVGGEPGVDLFPDGYFPEGRALEEAVAQRDLERVARLFVPYIVSEPEAEELVEQRIQAYLHLPEETLVNFFTVAYPTAAEFAPLLGRIEVPTLVIHGTADKITPLELGLQVAATIPGALFYPFEGRCHLCMVTATEEFCDVLREFVLTGKVSATGALEHLSAETEGASWTMK
jgi:class 3 adenylate cyclase/pimeloyl-ACP methyl ester carboxylesterase